MAKILIIDDDEAVREYLATLVTRLHHQAYKAATCAEGMALEQQFLQVLSQADGYHAEAGRLQLLRARMAPLARFELAQP
mgnify:CR=1 FL=1